MVNVGYVGGDLFNYRLSDGCGGLLNVWVNLIVQGIQSGDVVVLFGLFLVFVDGVSLVCLGFFLSCVLDVSVIVNYGDGSGIQLLVLCGCCFDF